jgi:glycine cleavage system H protein
MKIAGFEFPRALLYRVDDQTWARLDDDGMATVGITTLGIHQAGEIYMCRPKVPGSVVEQGRSIAVVELAKAIVSVRSPLTGIVLEGNPALAGRPELVHRDCYGEGWIARLRPTRRDEDAAGVVTGEAAAAALAHHAWLNGLGAEG